MSKFIIEIETDNAAFEDDPSFEVIRILENLIKKIEGNIDVFVDLYDLNGNRVGFAEYVER
jgi:hypothetical protein